MLQPKKLNTGHYRTTTGKVVIWGTPEYKKAYDKGEVVTDKGVKSPITIQGQKLKEVVVKNNYKRNWLKQYKDKIIEENKDAGILGAIIGTPVSAIASLPQLMGMKALTGEMKRPSEVVGFKDTGKWLDSPTSFGKNLSNTALDLVTDPANLIGAGVLTKENTLAKLGKTSVSAELKEGLHSNSFLDMFKSKPKEVPFIKAESNYTVPDTNYYSFLGEPVNLSKRQTFQTKEVDKEVSNWFNNKETYTKFIKEGGNKESYQKMIDNINTPVYSVDNTPGGSAGFLSDEGVSFVFDPSNTSLRTPEHLEQVPSIALHEKYHQSKIVDKDKETSLLPELWQQIEDLTNSKSYEKGSLSNYMRSPTEVYSKIGEIRQKAKILPGEIFSQETLEKAAGVIKNKEGKLTDFGKLPVSYFKNKEKWLNLINKMPALVPGAIGVGVLQQQKENSNWLDNLR
jgi:hypothetical protein